MYIKKVFNDLKWFINKIKPAIIPITFITILSSFSSILSVYEALISKNLVDSAINKNYNSLKEFIFIFIAIIIIQLTIGSLLQIIKTKSNENLKNSIHNALYSHIINSKWLYSSKYSSVEYLTRITNDTSSICSIALDTIPNIVSFSIMLLLSFITLIKFSKTLAFISITVFPIFLLIGKFLGRKHKEIYIDYQQETVKYNNYIQETIKNIIISKSFTLEKFHLSKLKEIQKNKMNISIRQCFWSIIANSILEIGSLIGYISALFFGVFSIFNGTNSFGTLVALMQLFNNIEEPFIKLSKVIPKIITCIAASERIKEIENLPSEDNINDNTNKNLKTSNLALSNISISIKNLYFKYSKSANNILENINLNIKSGEIIGIIGPSGEGKTTLVRILLSLIEPSKGDILIKNNSFKIPLNKNIRKYISYVPQENTLISGTIKENILLGNLKASNKDIKEALSLANTLPFINLLPNKFNTEINENSSCISGGQAQRISIARAFLKKAPIIILDEATSALDKKSEEFILNSLKTLDYNPIIIIITHKDTPLNICNSVYELKNKSLSLIKKSKQGL